MKKNSPKKEILEERKENKSPKTIKRNKKLCVIPKRSPAYGGQRIF